jgi:hypothetical protein
MKRLRLVVAFALTSFCLCSSARAQTTRWTEQKANAWYAQQPWLVGSNYVPKSAINQLDGTPYREAEVKLIRQLTAKH